MTRGTKPRVLERESVTRLGRDTAWRRGERGSASRLICLLLAILLSLFPTVSLAEDVTDTHRSWFIGLNPLAPFTEIDDLSFRMFAPFATGLEYDLAVAGGCFVSDSHMLESRFSLGFPHQPGFSVLGQLQAGYGFFLLEHLEVTEEGLYFGGALRYAGLRYKSADESFHSIFLFANLGYWFETSRGVFFDLRISQVLGALSWSSMEHTAPGFRFFASPVRNISPVLPLFTFTLGYRAGGS